MGAPSRPLRSRAWRARSTKDTHAFLHGTKQTTNIHHPPLSGREPYCRCRNNHVHFFPSLVILISIILFSLFHHYHIILSSFPMLHHFPLASGLVSLSRGNGEIRDIASAPPPTSLSSPQSCRKTNHLHTNGAEKGSVVGRERNKTKYQNGRFGHVHFAGDHEIICDRLIGGIHFVLFFLLPV